MTNQARCGLICDECSYRVKFNCPGCVAAQGKLFWGECPVAHCSIDQKIGHCGQCKSFVCERLHQFAFDPQQGDNGKRIENLKLRVQS